MRRAFLAVLIGALVAAGSGWVPRRAYGDDAAGRAAFNRGDAVAAEAEWRPAAEAGDAAAAFGLGEIYEQVRGDYGSAARWYETAAAQGSAAAEYRLMLIRMAGNKRLPPDLGEAYGWMLLVAASGRPADHLAALRAQLEARIDAATRARGEAFAAAWQAAHAPRPPSAAPPPAPPPPPDPRAELQQAMKAVDCAVLQTAAPGSLPPTISGTVPDDQARARLIAAADRLPAEQRPRIDVAVIPPPLCRSVVALNDIVRLGFAAETGVALKLVGGDAVLHEGQPIQVEIGSAVAYPVDLRIDYFTLDGQVLHMWPNPDMPVAHAAPGETVRFLHRDPNGADWDIGSAPFGTEMIALTATPQPLDLGAKRPPIEQAAGYLRDLAAALRKLGPAGGRGSHVASVFVHTAGKQP